MCNVLEIASRKYPKTRQTCRSDTIDRVNTTLSYDDFYSFYLIPNKPCIFEARITENWPCRKLWNVDGAPDFDALGLLFGSCTVPVVDCDKKYYNSQFKMDMKMEDYLSYWKGHGNKVLPEATEILYLKDWHCKKQFPNTPTYETPHYFSSDWLNEYYTANSDLDDDYMFVYMGPKGTWTPLHVDVLTSYSWSANIVGRKRWLLYPPGQEDFLRDTSGQLIYDSTSKDLSNTEKYKAYDKRILKCIDIIQEAGEIIFIPSGWHHQVWNLEDAISVNHNWINACNIMIVWQELKRELAAVMREVEDCKDMPDWSRHCQLMLRTSYGLDYVQFFDLISFVAHERLRIISDREHDIPCSKKINFSLNHCLFDLDAIRIVLMDLITEADAKSIYAIVCPKQEAHKLLNKIISLLQLQYSRDNV